MKNLILLLWLCLPVFGFSQVNYTVSGKLNTINYPSKVFIIYRDGVKNKLDSAVIKDHQFEFKGTLPDTSVATVMMDRKGSGLDDIWGKSNADEIQIYLVNGATSINANDSLYNAKVNGNKINDDYHRYNILMQSVMKKLAAAKTNDQFNEVEAAKKQLSRKFLAENPDSYVSLEQALPNIARGYVNADTVEPIFLTLSKNVRSTKVGVAYQLFLNNLRKTDVNNIAPEFTQADTNGNAVKLSSFRGKYVLVDFWASWCAPCRAENPNVVKAFIKYEGINFTVLGISLDKPGAKGA